MIYFHCNYSQWAEFLFHDLGGGRKKEGEGTEDCSEKGKAFYVLEAQYLPSWTEGQMLDILGKKSLAIAEMSRANSERWLV